MAVVALDGLTKRYGAFLAVDKVSFEVGKGEILGLLGPNGSGKTTILRMLTGYLRPSAGTRASQASTSCATAAPRAGASATCRRTPRCIPTCVSTSSSRSWASLRGLEREKLRETACRRPRALRPARHGRHYHRPPLARLSPTGVACPSRAPRARPPGSGRADERARSTPDHRIPGADSPGCGAMRGPDHIAYSRGNGAHSRSRGDPAPRASPCREGFGHGQGVLGFGRVMRSRRVLRAVLESMAGAGRGRRGGA